MCLLFKRSLLHNQSLQVNRKDIHWKPLDFLFFKLNFDGASKDNSGISRIATVIRDRKCSVLLARAVHIPNGTKATALVSGFKLATSFKLATKLGADKLIIEGDSMVIISTLKKMDIVEWKLKYILKEAWELLSNFAEYEVLHCYREANALGDALASKSCEPSFSEKGFTKDI
ncbi:hypothetical protein SUGI_0348610 [Cryptomeria japonica]|uniref:uncharacterized protein LOC131874889 n=1 Tax=Cryptomeria japonica TaxID=3369 RepID=UPI002408EBE1|nr:uncharacterized protein LOC131874889 [Cryptomeria japonica]GLJ19351.1 hypothetical protein SUGI_0348610 [Cryptomeria japonica]